MTVDDRHQGPDCPEVRSQNDSVYTKNTLGIHSVYTNNTLSLQRVYTEYTLSKQAVYSRFTRSIYSEYTAYTDGAQNQESEAGSWGWNKKIRKQKPGGAGEIHRAASNTVFRPQTAATAGSTTILRLWDPTEVLIPNRVLFFPPCRGAGVWVSRCGWCRRGRFRLPESIGHAGW